MKAQLHPHFLFNTLNNLYSHTLTNSAYAPDIVLKLSHVLRFMIYESNHERISLAKEIELLKQYVALEQLRYGERLEISLSVKGEIEQYEIPPLLLLPFLENAFKHGTSKQIDQCWISFDLAVAKGVMNFKLINSLDKDHSDSKAGSGGLGLSNTNRRLELLYGNRYNFETIMHDEFFIVILDIPLEPLNRAVADPVAQVLIAQ